MREAEALAVSKNMQDKMKDSALLKAGKEAAERTKLLSVECFEKWKAPGVSRGRPEGRAGGSLRT